MISLVDLMARWRTPADAETFVIDPFAWWPHAQSRIAGLGGEVAASDPNTVFHSAYHSFDAGRVRFTIAFDGLAATKGTLTIRLNAMTAATSEAVTIKSVKTSLATLAANGGTITIDASSRHGAAFALFALTDDETDASAVAVSIEANGLRAKPGPHPAMDKAKRIFSPAATDPIIVEAPATLARPWSQMCTIEQFEEPDYQRWIDRMHRPLHRHRKQWEFVYICRMLEAMDMLQTDSRGLGFGCGVEPLPAVFAALGIFVTATDLSADDPRAGAWQASDQLGLSLAALRNATIVDDAVFDTRVEFRNADMTAIADDLRDYDFTWSSCALEHLGSIEAGLAFMERSLDTLRPGGVAVHTTELNLVSDGRTIDNADTVLFRRRDILKLAKRLAGQGHIVHPISFDLGSREVDQYVDVPPYTADPHLKLAIGQYVTTSFGLAVRKAG